MSSHSCYFIASLDSISLPNKVFEALAHPDWRSAMMEEMDALTDNGTWDLRLDTFTYWEESYNPDGSIGRLNARFVATGYA